MSFSRRLLATLLLLTTSLYSANSQVLQKKPNIVFVMVDQFRVQSTGYFGNKDVITPNLDKLASESINLHNAISGMPVCTPFRASLLTGQYPTTNGVFMNDVLLDTNKTTIAKVYKEQGYDTGYIGKWHIDGHGRESYIPETRHQGFDYWKVLECTHDYNKSFYFEGNSPKRKMWEGYDAIAESDDASTYIRDHAKGEKPFMLFLSMGPPHNPYGNAPEKYKNLYKNKQIAIPANVPSNLNAKIADNLKDYYSHISALDDCIGKVWNALKLAGIEENTILVFTADHGDMMGSHGLFAKQKPYNESIKIPFLIHYPAKFSQGKKADVLLSSPDIMPTLLGLTGFAIPKSVEGFDFSKVLEGKKKDKTEAALIACVQPFGEWNRASGGKEYRGVVTKRYTYVKDLSGPWLLFDNLNDPLQMKNLVNDVAFKDVKSGLDKALKKRLKQNNDKFEPGLNYVKKWKYVIDDTETVPYYN